MRDILKGCDLFRFSKIRLIFIGPWMFYVVFAIAQARFDIRPIAVNLVWPFLFLYLVACLFEKAANSAKPVLRERSIWMVIALLVAVDHVFKFAINHIIPLGEAVPVIANRLHLANAHNFHGSFWFEKLGASPVIMQFFVLSVLSVVLAPLIFRFYSVRHRKSFWSVLAYSFFMATMASTALDLGARGFCIDYLELPGLFIADLKDIYLIIFVSAFSVEALSNPRITIRWLGWRAELREVPCIVIEIVKFGVGEIHRNGKPEKV